MCRARKLGAAPVDVVPGECEGLALAEPDCHRDHPEGFDPVTLGRGDELLHAIEIERLVGLGRRRWCLDERHDVALYQPPLRRERTAQHHACDTARARSLAGLLEVAEHGVHMRRGELRQLAGADGRDDRVLDDPQSQQAG
jgi:hypothetical protein